MKLFATFSQWAFSCFDEFKAKGFSNMLKLAISSLLTKTYLEVTHVVIYALL
jgi:hypothetical protein